MSSEKTEKADAVGSRLQHRHRPALRMVPLASSDDAIAVFHRKVPGATVEVKQVYHPFWWATLQVRTRGLLSRRAFEPLQTASLGPHSGSNIKGQAMHVLVNAHSNRSFIADFVPQGEEIDEEEWMRALSMPGTERPPTAADYASRAARALVRTKVTKTVKLGMHIKIDEAGPPRGILKPNWIVTGANDSFAATLLVDGLDGTHYVVRAQKLE